MFEWAMTNRVKCHVPESKESLNLPIKNFLNSGYSLLKPSREIIPLTDNKWK